MLTFLAHPTGLVLLAMALRGFQPGQSCVRLGELNERGLLALLSEEEWLCQPEETAQCGDYDPLVRPYAHLERGPGGYLCRLVLEPSDRNAVHPSSPK